MIVVVLTDRFVLLEDFLTEEVEVLVVILGTTRAVSSSVMTGVDSIPRMVLAKDREVKVEVSGLDFSTGHLVRIVNRVNRGHL